MSEDVKEIRLIASQAEFVTSDKRFPCFIGGIGTGKTMCLLLKAVNWCNKHPGSLGLIVRNQFTDLHDSTLNDFRKYFGLEADSHKEVLFDNGSKLMFRHGSETAVLKNINLDFCGFEQAEEFEDATQFEFLRDRLRGTARKLWNEDGTPQLDVNGNQKCFQQMFLIANCNGHDWLWRKWVSAPSSDEYHLITATTFDNAINLPESFLKDQMAREKDEPRHFRRMVMNCFDEDLADDLVFRTAEVTRAAGLNLLLPTITRYVAGLDVGRYGDDASCLTILAQVGVARWRQVFQEEKKGWSTVQVVGWVKDTWKMFPFDTIGVDDIGVGGGVTDMLDDSTRYTVCPFTANEKPLGVCPYSNKKAQGYFRLEEYISKEWLQILNDPYLHSELSTIKFYYKQDSIKHIVGKDEMRRQGAKSPNKAEALMIAMFFAEHQHIDEVSFEMEGVSIRPRVQEYAET